MEDVTADFQERADDFEEKFKDQLSKKKEYAGFLSRFLSILYYITFELM